MNTVKINTSGQEQLSFETSKLHILVGSTGVGKSVVLHSLACDIARMSHQVKVFSTDGTRSEAGINILSNLSGIPRSEILNADRSPELKQSLVSLAGDFEKLIHLSAQLNFDFNTEKLVAEIRRSAEAGIKFFFFDDLGSLAQADNNLSAQEDMNKIVKQLVEIADDLQVTIFATASAMKGGSAPPYVQNKRANLCELSLTTSIEGNRRGAMTFSQGKNKYELKSLVPIMRVVF
jgi:replicative DNA helicase